MYAVLYVALVLLLVAFGVPLLLVAACGAAQRHLAAKGLYPAAFALPAASGMAMLMAMCMAAQTGGWRLMCVRMVQGWAAGAFGGTVAGWVSGASRHKKQSQGTRGGEHAGLSQ